MVLESVITSYSIHYTKLYDFENIGGTFITPADHLKEKLSKIKAYIFDWDGVFNNGSKVGDRITSYNVCYTKLLR